MSDCYSKVRTAGFVVDSHTCYRCLTNSTMRFPPVHVTDEALLTHWPQFLDSPPFSTIQAAVQHASRPGYNVAVVRLARPKLGEPGHRELETVADHLLVNLSFSQVVDILQGREMHHILAFACAKRLCQM